jgi:uncharacterized phage protein gp47/JayE
MDRPTYQDLFRIGRTTITAAPSQITTAVVDREGSDANILVATAASIGDEISAQVARVGGSAFLDTATGADLDRLVFDRYGLSRKPASAALGVVRFSLASAPASNFLIPAGTLLSTPDGRQFVTLFDDTFLTTSTFLDVNVRSVLAGSSQMAASNSITSIISYPPSAPPGLTVTNPLATAGGNNQESDSEYRARARIFYTTLRRGTRAALEQAALAVPGVRTARAFEILNDAGGPGGIVELVISDGYTDALANTGSTIPAYDAQSDALAAAVVETLDDVRACGVFVRCRVAQVILQPVILQLSFIAGANVDTVAGLARAAITNYVNQLQPGADFVLADANAILDSVAGLAFNESAIASPTGNVVVGNYQVLRTNLALVTAGAIADLNPLSAR